jgi:outer membrane protein TolC
LGIALQRHAPVDDIRNEVQAAYEQTEESRQIVDLYKRKVVPAAQQNVEAARAGYEANNLGFLSLVESQRQLIDARMKQVEALADYHRRMAELQQQLAEGCHACRWPKLFRRCGRVNWQA